MCFQPLCRGGSFALESVAAFVWNGWQACSGISGRFGVEYASRSNATGVADPFRGLKEPQAPYMPLRAAHKTKAPGFAGGYLLRVGVDAPEGIHIIREELLEYLSLLAAIYFSSQIMQLKDAQYQGFSR